MWFKKKKGEREEAIKSLNKELDHLEKWKDALDDHNSVEHKIVLSDGMAIIRTKGGWVYADMPNTSDIQVDYAHRNLVFEILKELKELRGEIKELRGKK